MMAEGLRQQSALLSLRRLSGSRLSRLPVIAEGLIQTMKGVPGRENKMKGLPPLLCALIGSTFVVSLPWTMQGFSADEPTLGGRTSSTVPRYQSREELPTTLRQRGDALHAASTQQFASLDSPLDEFSVTEVSVPEAVAKLSNDYNVLCGIEVIPWPRIHEGLKPTALAPISLSVRHATPRQILDDLISLDPTFIWIEDQAVANLVVRSAYDGADYTLNIRIPDFHVRERPYTTVFGGPYPSTLFGLPEVRNCLVFGSSGRWPRELEPKVAVDAVDMTVREIINGVARKVGMSWSAVAAKLANGEDIVWFHMVPTLELLLGGCCGAPVGDAALPAEAGRSSKPAPPVTNVEGVRPATNGRLISVDFFPATRPAIDLNDAIKSFSLGEATVRSIVRTLSNDFGLRYGMDEVLGQTPAVPPKAVSLNVENMTLHEVLDKIVSLDPNYTLTADRGYVNLVLRYRGGMENNPLDIPIREFVVTEEPYEGAVMRIVGDIVRQTGWGARGVLAHLPQPTLRVTISLENTTPRQVLNEIARQVNMCWEMHSIEAEQGSQAPEVLDNTKETRPQTAFGLQSGAGVRSDMRGGSPCCGGQ